MIIKCRKGTRKNILYFSTAFTNEEIINLQNHSYDIKCHLKALLHILTDYTLYDLQLTSIIRKDLYLKISFRHNENPNQILYFSINLTPEGDFKDFYIILEGGNTYAPNFRSTACANVKEILRSILNREKGEHCETCVYKFKRRLSGKCGDLYSRNRYQRKAE